MSPDEEAKQVRARLRKVVLRAAELVLPSVASAEIEAKVISHTWRNQSYVGKRDSKVCVWRGHSINLGALNLENRVLYADYVAQVPPAEDHFSLFGPRFAEAISDLPAFAILYVCDIPVACADKMEGEFVPRLLQRSCHACRLFLPADLLKIPLDEVAQTAVRLVEFQRQVLGANT